MSNDSFIDVAKEYEKNKELKKEDIRLLEKWMSKQPHLPKVSELHLILFLHRCYYNIESTKRFIETFYTARARWPEFFKNRNPSINTKVTESVLFTPLPKLTPGGNRIFYVTFTELQLNVDKYHPEELLKSFDMAVMLMLHQLGTAPGHIVFFDTKGLTYEHILKGSPIYNQFWYYLKEVVPIRLVKFITVNSPSVIDAVFVTARSTFKQEYTEKIQIYHDNFDELHQLIPLECLPSDYGGGADSIEELARKRKANFLTHQNFFVQEEKDIADESKRLIKTSYASDILDNIKFNTFIDVQKEYEKNEELKKEDIHLLQEWVSSQPHLPEVSEFYLIFFLHRCYYDIEEAKKCIDTFYTLRARVPDFFKNKNTSQHIKTSKLSLFWPLSRRTPQGYQILFIKAHDPDPENYAIEEHINLFNMVNILMLHQTGIAPGHILLVDLSALTLERVAKLNIPVVKKFFCYIQEALPIRLMYFAFIRVPSYMSSFWALAKTFFHDEFVDKIRLYDDKFDEIYDIIPRECFPSDYGGEDLSTEELRRKMNENLLAHARFFADDETKIANESKRVAANRSVDRIFEEEELFSGTYGV